MNITELEILKNKVDNKTATKEEELLYYKQLNHIADEIKASLDDNLIEK